MAFRPAPVSPQTPGCPCARHGRNHLTHGQRVSVPLVGVTVTPELLAAIEDQNFGEPWREDRA